MANTRLTYGTDNIMNTMGSGGEMTNFPIGGGRTPHDNEHAGNVATKMENTRNSMAGGPPPPGANGLQPRVHTLPTTVDAKMDVPRNIVGFIMGKKGQGIKEMVRRSNGARFEFENADQQQENTGEGTRKLTITGNFEQVHVAYNLIHDKVDEFVAFHGMSI